MQQRQVFYIIAFRNIEEFDFNNCDHRAVQTHHNDHNKKLAKCICLMKTENNRKPVFGIVSDHAAKIAGDGKYFLFSRT